MAFANMQTGGLGPVIKSFPPVVDARAKVLILGSMPGKASLDAGEYYAHPRNLFWPIMGQLTGAIPELPYQNRLAMLQKSNVALWDVLRSCTREGSLDSDIGNEVPNDFDTFFTNHPKIEKICFNGTKAAESFEKHYPDVVRARHYQLVKLPSTSPAHASLTFEQKLESWKTII